MVHNKNYRIEFFATPIGPSLGIWFVAKRDEGTITNTNASSKSVSIHLLAEELSPFGPWPANVIVADVANSTNNTFDVSISTAFRNAYNTRCLDSCFCTISA